MQQDILYTVGLNSIQMFEPRLWSPEKKIEITVNNINFLAPIVILIQPTGI
jgi:hypothetical protein